MNPNKNMSQYFVITDYGERKLVLDIGWLAPTYDGVCNTNIGANM